VGQGHPHGQYQAGVMRWCAQFKKALGCELLRTGARFDTALVHT
jgi:hypothetical protein